MLTSYKNATTGGFYTSVLLLHNMFTLFKWHMLLKSQYYRKILTKLVLLFETIPEIKCTDGIFYCTTPKIKLQQ